MEASLRARLSAPVDERERDDARALLCCEFDYYGVPPPPVTASRPAVRGLLAGCGNSVGRVIDLQTGQHVGELRAGGRSAWRVYQLGPGNAYALSADCLWSLDQLCPSSRTGLGQEVRDFSLLANPAPGAAHRVASTTFAGALRVWTVQERASFDQRDHERARKGRPSLTHDVVCVCSRVYTEQLLASAVLSEGLAGVWPFNRDVELRGLGTLELVGKLRGHTDSVSAIAGSRDGRCAFTGSADLTVRVWDLQTAQCSATMRGHTDTVHRLAVNLDDDLLVSHAGDSTLRVWDPRQSGPAVELPPNPTPSLLDGRGAARRHAAAFAKEHDSSARTLPRKDAAASLAVAATYVAVGGGYCVHLLDLRRPGSEPVLTPRMPALVTASLQFLRL